MQPSSHDQVPGYQQNRQHAGQGPLLRPVGSPSSPYNQHRHHQPMNSEYPSSTYPNRYQMTNHSVTNPHYQQTPAFPYQGTSSTHQPYMNVGAYPPSRSPPHHSPPPGLSGYLSLQTFPSLNYPPPTSAPTYGYPPQREYPASLPMYPQYAPAPYPQPQYPPSSPEMIERQGSWWYPPLPPPPPVVLPQQRVEDMPGHPSDRPGSLPMLPSASAYYAAATSSPSKSSPAETPVKPVSGQESYQKGKKPTIRRPYHPNPPAHRSEWVMWVGNVPSDALHDELWRFFTRFPDDSKATSTVSGVLSIFLIARSSCAFVNYDLEHNLLKAIEHFNGLPLRSDDPHCLNLVCRIRKRDDDLKAGVGGQRGIGIHLRWIKEQTQRASRDHVAQSPAENMPSDLLPDLAGISISGDEDPQQQHSRQSSNGSHESTSSSVLSHYFPQRYFILKSLTQHDLDLSRENGLWATQRHNEGVLDRAFRTSQDVYLIFSVNKSGEFYGYARMAGPIGLGEHKVSWASRTSDSPPSSSQPPPIGRVENQNSSTFSSSAESSQSNLYFSPNKRRLVDHSPFPVDQSDFPPVKLPTRTPPTLHLPPAPNQSAPAELGKVHQKITLDTLPSSRSLRKPASPRREASLPDVQGVNEDEDEDEDEDGDELKTMAAIGFGRGDNMETGGPESDTNDAGRSGDDSSDAEQRWYQGKDANDHEDGEKSNQHRDEWGESFRIQWISTEKISFQKTRRFRNSWNHDREIKVSRDGTELEPGVGRRLLEEWASLSGKKPPI